MRYLFIEKNEITEEMRKQPNAVAKHRFKKVLGEVLYGGLYLHSFKVDKMYVVDLDNEQVIPAIFNGCKIKTEFINYNDCREVDWKMSYYTVIDENGKEYNSIDFGIYEDEEEAEEVLQNLLDKE